MAPFARSQLGDGAKSTRLGIAVECRSQVDQWLSFRQGSEMRSLVRHTYLPRGGAALCYGTPGIGKISTLLSLMPELQASSVSA